MSLFDYFGSIRYINLATAKNKNEYFIEQISQSKLANKAIRFEAINGKNIDLRLIENDIITDSARRDIAKKNQRTYGVSLTYGSLGCALSHYLLYQELQSETKPCLIFEDDIIIDQYFDDKLLKILAEIMVLNLNYDIFYLGLYDLPSLIKKENVSNLIYRPQGLTCGTYGMIVTPNGAKNILKKVFPINVQIDSAISAKKQDLKVYASKENIVGHLTSFGSTTQKEPSCVNRATHHDRSDGWQTKLFGM